jgi:hypothetical protein
VDLSHGIADQVYKGILVYGDVVDFSWQQVTLGYQQDLAAEEDDLVAVKH